MRCNCQDLLLCGVRLRSMLKGNWAVEAKGNTRIYKPRLPRPATADRHSLPSSAYLLLPPVGYLHLFTPPTSILPHHFSSKHQNEVITHHNPGIHSSHQRLRPPRPPECKPSRPIWCMLHCSHELEAGCVFCEWSFWALRPCWCE